jgi:hypothetical protein
MMLGGTDLLRIVSRDGETLVSVIQIINVLKFMVSCFYVPD